jgi:hypothetical protein
MSANEADSGVEGDVANVTSQTALKAAGPGANEAVRNIAGGVDEDSK